MRLAHEGILQREEKVPGSAAAARVTVNGREFVCFPPGLPPTPLWTGILGPTPFRPGVPSSPRSNCLILHKGRENTLNPLLCRCLVKRFVTVAQKGTTAVPLMVPSLEVRDVFCCDLV